MSSRIDAPPAECDLVVVGGGIVGLAVAREVLRRRPIARLCLLEGEHRLAAHQTGHTSGVVHAGIYYEPGSLKARLCVQGARELFEFCAQQRVPHRRDGKLIVAVDETELPRLDELERRGHENGVEGLRRIGANEIPEIEPHARGLAALHSPATGVVDFAAVARALADDVERSGGTIHCGCRVTGTSATGGRLVIRYRGGLVRASAGIFCAGLWSDRLAVAAGAPRDPQIVPFRGAFVRLTPARQGLVRSSIYPVPDPELPFLGAHLTRSIDGQVMIGPSALMATARDAYRFTRVRPRDIVEALSWPGTWRLAVRHRHAALTELRRALGRRSITREAARLVPELRPGDTRRGPAGIRAQALSRAGRLVDDFVVHVTERAVHVRNAPSPAATSALPLARLIADELETLR